MKSRLSVDEYNALIKKIGNSYMPEEKKKPKLSFAKFSF